MDRPDPTRRGFAERFHFTNGGGRDEGFCGIEWHPLTDGRLLAIAHEHPDNPGQSVTNAAEDIYGQFATLAGVDRRRVVWVESYPPEEPGQPPAFDLCTFSPRLTAS